MILKKEFIKGVFITFILFLNFAVYSQGFNQTQMSQIEVDNLSDKQVVAYRDRIKEEGYTLDQALSIAKTKGMSELQVQKLKAKNKPPHNTWTP